MEKYEMSEKVESEITRWLVQAPLLGNMQLKSRMIFESPRAYLETEELACFLNGIRNEYVSTVSEYLSEESPPPEVELRLEILETKLIDDTMNYLLFLIDQSPGTQKLKEHAEESERVLEDYGIKTVSEIMQKPDSTCKCLDWLLQEKTYGIRVPHESLKAYYGRFQKAKTDHDRLANLNNLKARYPADISEFNRMLNQPEGIPSNGSSAKNIMEHWTGLLEGIPINEVGSATGYLRNI